MGQAAALWAAAGEIEDTAGRLRDAVPEHWTGRAAEQYQRSASNLATGLDVLEARVGSLASRLHLQESEVAAVRAALATGAMVAV